MDMDLQYGRNVELDDWSLLNCGVLSFLEISNGETKNMKKAGERRSQNVKTVQKSLSV